MADIFLSYAREDIKKAELLATALESQGWTVFWDRTSLLAGQDFEAVIEQAIQQAGCMVVAWSTVSKQSDRVRGEAGIGRERNILVPILFEPIEPPIAFRSLHTENLADWDGTTDALDFLKLCKAINERLTSKTATSSSSTPTNNASNKTIESSKTNPLKRLFSAVWDWLSVTKHQQTLAFIGGGLAVIIGGGWQAYLQFSKKPAEANSTISVSGNGIANTGNMTATVANGGNATSIVGNNNTVGDPNTSANIKEIVATLTSKHQLDSQAKDEQIKALTEAVTALSKGQNILGTKTQIDEALQALAQNDTTLAKALFTKATQKADQEAKEGAKAYSNLGALAFLDNTEEALKAYRRATELDPDNANGWNKLGLLLKRSGELDEAIHAYQKVMALGEAHHERGEQSAAYGNLGVVYNTQGDLAKASEYYHKSLAIEKSLGRKEGMAIAYGNLGILYYTQGDLAKASEYHQKALAIHESLCSKEGIAAAYNGLGNVHKIRGDLAKAIEYYHKSLATDKSQGRKEGIASSYTNLGGVYYAQGDLDKAGEYYHEALTIEESLGRKEGMADAYNGLGIVHNTQGDLAKAIEYHHKALAIDESLGRKVGMADAYNSLGNVHNTQGDLAKAIEYYHEALAIDESLGRKEGIAIAYANLGRVYAKQGDKVAAKKSCQKSLDLFKALRNTEKIKLVQGWLDALEK